MSYTEIYRFNKDGTAVVHAWVDNPWRGAMSIWKEMEHRHLPIYAPHYLTSKWWYRPGIAPAEIQKRLGYLPSRLGPGTGEACEELFALADNPTIPLAERIVLYTTFDDILIRHEDIPRVIEAFNAFEGDTSLPIQAKILERLYTRNDCIAVGWNQTTVTSANWGNRGGSDCNTDEDIPYNCLTMNEHHWLFEELKLDVAEAPALPQVELLKYPEGLSK